MNRYVLVGVCFGLAAGPVHAQTTLSPADRAAAFKAAGFARAGAQWRKCDDPGTASYSPGEVETVRDLNGDGRPEAIIVEGSTYCFGNTGTGFGLVSKEANGTWRLMLESPGVATVLTTKGAGGWPDVEVGGPGFCFPVQRWDGAAYRIVRRQYEGKPCRR